MNSFYKAFHNPWFIIITKIYTFTCKWQTNILDICSTDNDVMIRSVV